MLGPQLYGDLWEQMFLLAPDFDSQGERGQNSLADTDGRSKGIVPRLG